jgi:hypothetical protein
LYRILSSYWAGAALFVEKSAKGLLFFGLDCGMLDILVTRVIQRTIVGFPAFFKHGTAEKIAVCAHTNRVKQLRTLNFFQKFKTKIKKLKTHSS